MTTRDERAGAPAGSATIRLLVVDDDDLDRLAVRRCVLQSAVSATMDEASSAAEALALVRPSAYDCVLLDYYLPGTDSVALLHQLRAAAPETPVVIFTGRGDEAVAVEFMKAGAADYMPKATLTPERLAAGLRYALELSRSAQARQRAEEDLREQEARFRTLANTIPQLAWMTDPEGSVYWYNERWYQYTGTTLDDVRGWKWQTVHHPDHVERVVERKRRCILAGEPWEDTFPLRRADGEYRWFLSRAVPIRRADGGIAGWLGTNTDVTDQLERERQLRERESEFRTLANAIPQLAWVADSDGRRYWYNDRWYEYTGLRPDEALGLGWHLVLHPDERARIIHRQRDAFERGGVWEETLRLRRRDGVFGWFLARAVPVRSDEGRVLRWFGTNTDITERLDAEHALAASEERFRRALDIETVGVLFFTMDGEITGANDAFLRMSGYTREDLATGQVRWEALTAPEFLDLSRRALEEFRAAGRTAPYEKQGIRKDGSRWWALFASTRLNEREGVEFILDVTEQKAIEEERERLLEAERDARAQAEQATRLRDEVLAILAHDLRNPMHTIVGAASMLALTAEEDKRQRQVAMIQRATQAMERLVTDLLDMGRIESGTFAIRRDRVDLHELVREALEMCEPQAQARGVSLRAEVASDVHPLAADRERLLQLLSNLLANALKFSPAGARVSVRGVNAGDGAQISVKDSGRGIPAEHLPHIFDRFWQATPGSGSGAGLGLAICKGIVDAHGGRIWAASTVGRGTTIHVYLPHGPSPTNG